jgi:ribosomal protein S18 acetylase RimI-like enzyme
MTAAPFRFEPLSEQHDRGAFRCGEAHSECVVRAKEGALDKYFQTQVTQDIRRRVANCFVAVETATERVAAYYTLSAASIPLTELPAASAQRMRCARKEETKRLPRYPAVPAVRIGRLAVDQHFQRRGLGELMLMNVVHRTIQGAAAAFALLVDAKNEVAVNFYQRYGFRPIAGRPRTLFLPLATAQKTLVKLDSVKREH